jgi:hypothetical protein
MEIFLGAAIAPIMLFVLQVIARSIWLLISPAITNARLRGLLTHRIW